MEKVGKLYPAEAPRPGSSEGEVKVWKALKAGLPPGWRAWHSLRIKDDFKRGNGKYARFEGETDFLIADPERGFIVLEVKGGVMTQRDGRWYQNGRPMDQEPLPQAQEFAKNLAFRLRALGAPVPPYGVAACFPDTYLEQQPNQDNLRGRVIGAQELPYLEQILPDLLERELRPHYDDETLPKTWLSALHELWGERWAQSPALAAEAPRFHTLSEAQAAALDGLMANDLVLLEGPAGSGKTLIAAEAARKNAARGQSTRLLCYTQALAKHLDAALPELRASTVDAYALQIAEALGAPMQVRERDPAFWEDLPFEVATRLEEAGPGALPPDLRADALIIDEAQDLREAHWALIEVLAPRRLWLLRDTRQAFWADRAPPERPYARFELPASERCPPGVLALAEAVAGRPHEPQAIRAALDARQLELIPAPPEARERALAAQLTALMKTGLRPDQIFVISLRGRSQRGDAPRTLAGQPLVPAGDKDAHQRVVADSFLRLKGLERAAVVLCDLDQLEEGSERERGTRLYVALTRALQRVSIIAPAETFAADPVLAPYLPPPAPSAGAPTPSEISP